MFIKTPYLQIKQLKFQCFLRLKQCIVPLDFEKHKVNGRGPHTHTESKKQTSSKISGQADEFSQRFVSTKDTNVESM